MVFMPYTMMRFAPELSQKTKFVDNFLLIHSFQAPAVLPGTTAILVADRTAGSCVRCDRHIRYQNVHKYPQNGGGL